MFKKFFAILLLFLCVHVHAETAREYFKFAKFSLEAHEYHKALDFINTALTMDPHYANGFLLRAHIHMSLKNYENVVSDISEAFEIDLNLSKAHPESHLLRGDAYFQLDELSLAKIDINNCINLNPQNAQSYYLKAIIYTRELKYFEALENFDLAIKHDSDESEYYLKRAELKKIHFKPLPGTKTYDSILEDIRLASSLNPDDYRPFRLKCDMLKLDQHYDKNDFINELTANITRFPDQAEFYTERGISNVLVNNYELAISDFTRAISLEEFGEANYRNRGLCFHNLRKYQLALNDYTKSIEILVKKFQSSDNNPAVKKLLAQTFNMRGMTNQINGHPDLACEDYYNAAKLGSKSGLNNYRKNCNVYN